MRALLVGVLLLAGCATSPAHPAAVGPPAARHAAPRAATAAVDPAVAATWPRPLEQYTPGTITPGCTYPRATSERSVLTSTKTTAAADYGYTGGTGLTFVEYDHRIPFSLCGGNGLANIWPEPVDGVTQSTYVHNRKDQLEAFAARQVRYGRWSLAFAQSVFRGDWVAGWCRYLHYTGVTC